jgi:4-coumarate--CoA ligase
MIGTPEEANRYQWKPMKEAEATKAVATVNYSSGTTGLPKGVCVSHYNLIANTEQTIAMKYHGMDHGPGNAPPERWLGFLPLYHAYGQLWCMMIAIKLNIPTYVMETFKYEAFLGHIQQYKITHLQSAPPILVMLSKRPETANYDISSVKHILCGAAPLSKELQNDITRRFGIRVTQGWGMTEVTCGAMHVPFSVDDE